MSTEIIVNEIKQSISIRGNEIKKKGMYRSLNNSKVYLVLEYDDFGSCLFINTEDNVIKTAHFINLRDKYIRLEKGDSITITMIQD